MRFWRTFLALAAALLVLSLAACDDGGKAKPTAASDGKPHMPPVQSLAMATLRAVENRRALVRSANTGISGFIDPLGRISAETRLFTEEAVAEAIPLLRSQTLFTRMGHGFGFFCAALILPLAAPALLARIERRRAEKAGDGDAAGASA